MTPEQSAGGQVCTFLDWDTAFFGVRVARVTASTLTPQTTRTILEWCAARDIDCLYFLGSPGDSSTVRTAEDHGFRFVDIRMSLDRRGESTSVSPAPLFTGLIRPATCEDVPRLAAIARTGFRQTRFHFDPDFCASRADALYETWIEQSCRGGAQAVLVAEYQNTLAGYITVHIDGDNMGRIGLLGVGEQWQSHGVGRALVSSALLWCEESSLAGVSVVTQCRNVPALRLYERCGFVVRSVELWYHRWFNKEASRATQ